MVSSHSKNSSHAVTWNYHPSQVDLHTAKQMMWTRETCIQYTLNIWLVSKQLTTSFIPREKVECACRLLQRSHRFANQMPPRFDRCERHLISAKPALASNLRLHDSSVCPGRFLQRFSAVLDANNMGSLTRKWLATHSQFCCFRLVQQWFSFILAHDSALDALLVWIPTCQWNTSQCSM